MASARHVGLFCVALVIAGCDNAAPTTTAGAVASAASASAATSLKKPPKRPPPIDGEPLYQRYCALCHGKDAKGYVADNAPSLVSRTFLESASNGFIAWGIRVGRPGTAMAAYGKRSGGPLSEAEIQAIVRFLRSKGPMTKPTPLVGVTGSHTVGERLYQQHCTKCHGTEKERGKAPMLFNPEFLRSAMPAFLKYAIEHGRPPTEMAAFDKTLNAAEIDDVVAYLRSKAPGYKRSEPNVDLEALAKLPVVLNPKGKAPTFTLRKERYVPIDEVKKAWEQKRRMVIIDARAASDFISAHIPGSISNPYYDRASLDRIPKDDTWVLAYCACPHHASGEVIDELRHRGYKNTAVLDEGILEWQKRGYPVEGTSAKKDDAKSEKK